MPDSALRLSKNGGHPPSYLHSLKIYRALSGVQPAVIPHFMSVCFAQLQLTPDKTGLGIMRPTGHFLNPTFFFIELIESGIGIGLQRTLKGSQMSLGMFPLAIGRVGKPHRR